MIQCLVSVVVPVYNVDAYLKKCLNSIVNQTYKKLEIILVDDGSTDTSGKICDEYEKLDNRIRVIHKKNGGLSSARNEGMKLVTGDYVLFVDSDDWIDLDMVEILLAGCVENSAQISICRYREIYKDYIIEKQENIEFVCSGKEALHYHIFERGGRYSFCYAVWNKLYKKEIISNMEFPQGKHFEDIGYTSRALYSAERVYYIDKPKYNYVVEREGSIMNNGFTEHKVMDELILLDKEISFFRDKNLKEYEDYCIDILMSKICFYYAVVMIKKNVKSKDECYQILRQLHSKYRFFYKSKKGKKIKNVRAYLFEKNPMITALLNACLAKMRLPKKNKKR